MHQSMKTNSQQKECTIYSDSDGQMYVNIYDHIKGIYT